MVVVVMVIEEVRVVDGVGVVVVMGVSWKWR